MALLPILRFPDPRLKKVAAPVAKIDDNIRRLVADMADRTVTLDGNARLRMVPGELRMPS